MTHGGLLGSSEAAYCGVPVILTPFYGDQFLNSAAMESRGMGVILKYNDINKENVNLALRRALDSKMKVNAKKVSYSYTHRPMTPKEGAVYWSEYVIATGGAPLSRPHSADAHWIVYSVLDIYLFILSAIILSVIGWIYVWRRVFTKAIADEPKKSHALGRASTERSFRGTSVDKKIK